jgi:hypothetical protein
VLCQHAAYDIFVEVDTERMRDLLRDAHTTELGIAAFELNDCRNEFRGRTFRTGFSATEGGGKEQAVFPIHHRLVELE